MKPSELPLAPDGSLYHIRLTRSTLADKVLLVGDPERVNMFKDIFDSVEFESQNREIHALTGTYHGTRLTALSTGMGCDNIDIVLTELDAALHVENGEWQPDNDRHLQLVRIGTSGSLQPDIDCGSVVASAYAIGLDGLMNYYREWDFPLSPMNQAFMVHMGLGHRLASPYCVRSSEQLLLSLAPDCHQGITVTAPGFYGPQGRVVRLGLAMPDMLQDFESFEYKGWKITNFEMEGSALAGLAAQLGHNAATICCAIAHRYHKGANTDYKPRVAELVKFSLDRLAR
jgi:uridine phosphorylase